MGGDADEALARACSTGDPRAWDELVGRLSGLVEEGVRRTARRQGISLSDAEVEELRAGVFSSLVSDDYRRLKRYDPRYPLAAYLRVIARSQVLDALRARRRRKEAESDARAAGAPPDPSELLGQQELRKRLEKLLEELSPKERTVVRFYFFADRTCPEIARILRIPSNTVFSLLRRSLEKLADRMGSGG